MKEEEEVEEGEVGKEGEVGEEGVVEEEVEEYQTQDVREGGDGGKR